MLHNTYHFLQAYVTWVLLYRGNRVDGRDSQDMWLTLEEEDQNWNFEMMELFRDY